MSAMSPAPTFRRNLLCMALAWAIAGPAFAGYQLRVPIQSTASDTAPSTQAPVPPLVANGLSVAPGAVTLTLTANQVTLGGPVSTQIVTVTNSSGAAMTGIDHSPSTANPDIQASTCFDMVNGSYIPLAAGASCTVTLVVDPARPLHASTTLDLYPYAGDGDYTTVVQVPVSVPAPVMNNVLTTTPASVSFTVTEADVTAGQAAPGSNLMTQIVTLTNAGTDTILGVSYSTGASTNPSVSASTCTGSLAVNATCTVTLAVDPGKPIAATAALLLNPNAGNNSTSGVIELPISVAVPATATIDPIASATVSMPGALQWSSGMPESLLTLDYLSAYGPVWKEGYDAPYANLALGQTQSITVTAKTASGKSAWIEILNTNPSNFVVVASGFSPLSYVENPAANPAACAAASAPTPVGPQGQNCAEQLQVNAYSYGPAEKADYATRNPRQESMQFINWMAVTAPR